MVKSEFSFSDNRIFVLRSVAISIAEIHLKIKDSTSADELIKYSKAIHKLSKAYTHIIKTIERR